MADTETEPTAEETASALAVLERSRNALATKLKAALPAANELVAMPGYADLLAKATELRAQFTDGQPFYSHMNAMIQGMQGILNDIALAGTLIPAAAPTDNRDAMGDADPSASG